MTEILQLTRRRRIMRMFYSVLHRCVH